MSNYLVPLLKEYLRQFDLSPKTKCLQIVLESAPSFPSFLSVQQTCIYFGLKTKAYRADYDVLLESTLPVIVHLKTEREEKFVLVKSATPESVTCYDASKDQKINIAKKDFCLLWTGALLISEKCRKQLSFISNTSFRNSWVYGLAVGAILMVFLLGFRISPATISLYFTLGLFVTKAAGVWLTAIIMMHEAGITYLPFERFCKKNENFDCNKVLTSNASRIFNTFSLAEIGTVYFLTGTFVILINSLIGMQNEILLILFYGSLCALPFILFSVLYQKFIVKKWCPFCLGVMGLIIVENLVFLFIPEKVYSNTSVIFAFVGLTISLIMGILTVHTLKKLLNAQADSFNSKLQSLRIKRNPVVLVSLFNRKKITEVPRKHNIVIGNSKAPLVISTILNPMCNPCKKLTGEIVELLKNHPEYFCWHIRFDGVEEETGDLNRIQLHLMQLCNQEENENLKLKIISDWYHNQSFRWFSSKYPIQVISPETNSSFAEVIIENKKLDVTKLPVVWVNNKELPEEYSISDIPYLATDVNLFLHVTKQLLKCRSSNLSFP